MYSYSCLASGEGAWPPLQPLTYTYLPGSLLLLPIHAHSFCSRPPSLTAGEWPAPREYHCFHGSGAPLAAALPSWAFPQAYAAALYPPFPAPGYLGPSLQGPAAEGTAAAHRGAPWPEGGTLQTELRWGHVHRAHGPRLELPDVVRRELRRVYGTYPRTDVRVTYRGGQFLLQGAPHVPEPEYRVQRRVLRPPASSDSGDSSPATEAAERGRRRKRKGPS
ncbi:uncharacterized protein C10orf95 homolog [Mirounga angustirostris]|uniref:Uncharacterized protein C10orf95 homolog n=1 Tax=Neomonachus schauinslandi TaxID=29088 RepID=A0A2Y9I269_NEOSC|nr:uncharacterized protein C10orf95 homolog [Neomonachus schauinslandi]XP_034883932.1 uncharacterized protein C10orf95 homolog [Mirounga leonina]XP_045734660.1 uncharacterized protein C10orf95 homolog [Mirounga angustirostris]